MNHQEFEPVVQEILKKARSFKQEISSRANLPQLISVGPDLETSQRMPLHISLYFLERGAGDALFCLLSLVRLNDGDYPTLEFVTRITEGLDIIPTVRIKISERQITPQWIMERADEGIQSFRDHSDDIIAHIPRAADYD
jgi:hypothetical protein